MAINVTIDGIEIRVDLHEGGGGICYVSQTVLAGTSHEFAACLVASGGEFETAEWQDRKARAIAAAWEKGGEKFLADRRRYDLMTLDANRKLITELQRKAARNAETRAEALAEIQRLRRKLGV